MKATFRHGHGEPAFGTIVRAFHQTFADQIANGVLNFDLMRKIDMRRGTNFQAVTNFQIPRAAECGSGALAAVFRRRRDEGVAATDENDDVPSFFEPLRGDVFLVIN